MRFSIIRLVTLPLIAICISTSAHAAERERVQMDRSAEGFLQTDRARFLETRQFHDALAKAVEKAKAEGQTPKPDKEPMAVADEVVELLLAELATDKGVHIETALTALGAMAGFSCQMAIREGFVASGKVSLDDAFVQLTAKSGETFYTGPLLDGGLLSTSNLSVWNYVGGAVAGAKRPIPDLDAIVMRTAASYGKADYGSLAVPAEHQPRMKSEELLWKYWNVFRNTLVAHQQEPRVWPVILGAAAQKLIVKGKDVIDPTLAAQIVMGAAIPMSRIDPDRIYAASFP